MMQAQQVVADAEPELMMSWKAICDKYPHQWVVLVETDWVEVYSFMFRSTRVFAHGPTRAAVLEPVRAAMERYHGCGVFHTKRTGAPPLPHPSHLPATASRGGRMARHARSLIASARGDRPAAMPLGDTLREIQVDERARRQRRA